MKKYFSELRAYLADNPEGYWFKAKLYGWGWTPARWEGWVIIGLFLSLVLLLSSRVDPLAAPRDLIWSFFVPLVGLIALLLGVCYAKGEKPRWQWGRPDRNRKV